MSVTRFSILTLCVTLFPAAATAQPLAFQRDDIDRPAAREGSRQATSMATAGSISSPRTTNRMVSASFSRSAAARCTPVRSPACPAGRSMSSPPTSTRTACPTSRSPTQTPNQINFFSFKPSGHTSWTIPGGANPRSLTSGDIDRDGSLDHRHRVWRRQGHHLLGRRDEGAFCIVPHSPTHSGKPAGRRSRRLRHRRPS